jgi:hypothetical protein
VVEKRDVSTEPCTATYEVSVSVVFTIVYSL